jgi:murein DD-endopeptidase MepM/ murein hydrolase activator NlpD
MRSRVEELEWRNFIAALMIEVADRGADGRRIRGVLLALAFLGLIAWVIIETEPMWRRYYRLWTAPAPTHLPVPVQGVPPRGLANTWHSPRDGGSRMHMGIDIFAKRGTPVVSPVEGIVIGQGEDRLGGNTVRVLGPGRQVHYFAHLDAFSDANPRDWVQPGAILGYVGTTGHARGTPPHLHYGVYGAMGAINPYPLLKVPPQ